MDKHARKGAADVLPRTGLGKSQHEASVGGSGRRGEHAEACARRGHTSNSASNSSGPAGAWRGWREIPSGASGRGGSTGGQRLLHGGVGPASGATGGGRCEGRSIAVSELVRTAWRSTSMGAYGPASCTLQLAWSRTRRGTHALLSLRVLLHCKCTLFGGAPGPAVSGLAQAAHRLAAAPSPRQLSEPHRAA